jgi:hypothetical protein
VGKRKVGGGGGKQGRKQKVGEQSARDKGLTVEVGSRGQL